jgi:archaetidylinositol phosphate synthase
MFQASRQDVESHSVQRELHGVLSPYEAPLLASLAGRLPFSVAPDHLTVAGVVGAMLAAAGLIASHLSHAFLWLALLGLALNWFGDSLDGTVARLRRIERPRYGFFVDHMSDVASQFLIVLGLGLSPFVRFDVVCLGLVSYLVLMVYTLVKLHVRRVMQLSYFGVGPTEVRLFIGFGIITAPALGVPCIFTPMGLVSPLDLAVLIFVAFALTSSVAMFLRDAADLSALDPSRHGIPEKVAMIEVLPSDRSG